MGVTIGDDDRNAKRDLPPFDSLVSADFRTKARVLLETLSLPPLAEIVEQLRSQIETTIDSAGTLSDNLVRRRENGELWDGWSTALREKTGAGTPPYDTTTRLYRLAAALRIFDELPDVRRELREAIAWPEKPSS